MNLELISAIGFAGSLRLGRRHVPRKELTGRPRVPAGDVTHGMHVVADQLVYSMGSTVVIEPLAKGARQLFLHVCAVVSLAEAGRVLS